MLAVALLLVVLAPPTEEDADGADPEAEIEHEHAAEQFEWPPDPTFEIAKNVTLRFGALLQLRYTTNQRLTVPREGQALTLGFNIPRIRLALKLDASQRFSAFVRMGINSGGAFRVERAYADVRPTPVVTIRGGQFYLPFVIEQAGPSPQQTQPADFSVTGNTFEPGASAGIMLLFLPWKLRLTTALTNGLRTGFSEVGEAQQADIATSGYFELRAAGDDWNRFNDVTSFRGYGFAAKLGLGGHYQTGGRTGNSVDTQISYLTADAQLEGNGWSLFGEFIGVQNDLGPTFDSSPGQASRLQALGVITQGGVFVARSIELFGRFDFSYTDGKQRPEEIGGGGTQRWFRTATIGMAYHPFAPSHSGRVVVDYQHFFDPTAGSIVAISPNSGLLPATIGQQFAVRLQWDLGF